MSALWQGILAVLFMLALIALAAVLIRRDRIRAEQRDRDAYNRWLRRILGQE